MLSSDANGNVSGLKYRDEDIIAYDQQTQKWTLFFDGSDVGLGNVDIDAFALLPVPGGDPQLLLSVDKDFTLKNFGAVDESDILRFLPTQYGETTRGSYALYFDGSAVGLENKDEDVDAIGFDANGNLLISVDGAFNAQGLKGADEDLFQLSNFVPGGNTSGVWSLYFDGSGVKLSSKGEDLMGLWTDPAHSQLYLTTRGNFAVPGASGDENDILLCRYTTLGNNTACTFTVIWNGDTLGFDKGAIDGLALAVPPMPVMASDTVAGDSGVVDDTLEYADDDINEADPLDGEEVLDETDAIQNNRIFLPLIEN